MSNWLTSLEQALLGLDPQALHAATFGLLFAEGMGIPGVPGVLPMLAQVPMIEAGETTLMAAIFWGTLGNWLGSIAGYSVGRWGRHLLPERWLQRLDSPQAMHWLERYGGALVIVSRVIGALRTPVTFGAGAARYPFPAFITYSLVGAVLHIGVWQWLLWAFGREIIDELEKQSGVAILAILGAATLAYVVWKLYRHYRKRGAMQG